MSLCSFVPSFLPSFVPSFLLFVGLLVRSFVRVGFGYVVAFDSCPAWMVGCVALLGWLVALVVVFDLVLVD